MKYIKKIPPTNKELSKKLVSDGWKKLKEPSNLPASILLSLPFMFLNGFISIAIAYFLYPPLRELPNNNRGFSFSFTLNIFTLVYFVIIIVFMVIHEFLHALIIPDVLRSDKVFWGFNGLYGFVCTNEKIKKSRFIFISIIPFVVLSIILPFILSILGLFNGFTVFLCLINALGSSVDLLNMLLVAIQVPNGSYIVNNGFETYYNQTSN